MQGIDVGKKLVDQAAGERRRRESGRSRITGLITLAVIGIIGAVLAFGIGPAKEGSTAAPTCDNEVMQQGDHCEITNRGSSNTYTYDQMVNNTHNNGHWMVIAGYVALALAVVLVIPIVRNLDTKKPWGTAVPALCPKCGRQALQEKKTVYSYEKRRRRYSYSAMVTICAPGCDFSASRQP